MSTNLQNVGIPDRWQISLDSEEVGFADLSWDAVLTEVAKIDCGKISAQSGGECVNCEFNATHAAVLYMGPDGVILRPYFPGRPPEEQDVTPYFCNACGILEGPMDDYLAKFFNRCEGFNLFGRILRGPSLPTSWPESGSEARTNVLEWRPLTIETQIAKQRQAGC